MMLRTCLPLLVLVLATAQGHAQQIPDPNFHIYILMGQSNMAGRGVVTDEYKDDGHPRLLMLSKEGEWVAAQHPLHFDKPGIAGVGPGMAFGVRMAEKKSHHRIGLVPAAVGGTSIERWSPGAYDEATKTHPYDDALARIRKAMQYGVIRGIIWHQGESNISSETSDYVSKVTALIERVREEVGDLGLPFIMGEIGRFKEGHEKMNSAFARISKSVPNTAVVSSRRLHHKGDGVHFDSRSAARLGKRFAKAMLRVERKSS